MSLPPINNPKQDNKVKEMKENALAKIRTALAKQEKAEEAFDNALEAADECWLTNARSDFSVVAEPEVGEFYELVSAFNNSFSVNFKGYCVVNDAYGAIFLGEFGEKSVDSKDMNVVYWCLQKVLSYDVSDTVECDATRMVRDWKALERKPTRAEFEKWKVQEEFAAVKRKFGDNHWLNKWYKDVKPVAELTVGKYYLIIATNVNVKNYEEDESLDKLYAGYCVVNDAQGAIFFTESGRMEATSSLMNDCFFLEYSDSGSPEDVLQMFNKESCDRAAIVKAWKGIEEIERPATRAEFEKWYKQEKAEEAFDKALEAVEPADGRWLNKDRRNFSVVAEPKVGEFYEIFSDSNNRFSHGYCVVNDAYGAIFLDGSGEKIVFTQSMNVTFWCVQNVPSYESDKVECDATRMVQAWKALERKPTRDAFRTWVSVQEEFAAAVKKLRKEHWMTDYQQYLAPVTELEVGEYYNVTDKKCEIDFRGYCVVNDAQGAIFLKDDGIYKIKSNSMKDYFCSKEINTETEGYKESYLKIIKENYTATRMVQAWKALKRKPTRKAILKWASDYIKPTRPSGKRSSGKRPRRARGYVEFRF